MDGEGRELLAGFSRSQSPGAAQQAQAWEAIEARIALGDVGPPVSEGASAAGVWGKVALAVIAGGAVVLAFFGADMSGDSPHEAGPLLSRVVIPDQEPLPEPVDPAPVPEPHAVTERATEVAAAPTPAPVPAARTQAPSRTKQTAAAKPPVVPPASSLAEEMKLLRRASKQLKTKAFSKALATLAEHDRRFPHGALAAERQIRRAEVHCKRGETAAARRVVDAFLRAHPETTLRTRALGICKPQTEGTP